MYKVLIVDDDPMVAMINTQYVCKNKNFTVVGSCRNGKDAIEFLKANNIDLIILDVFMPIQNGVETLKQIRELKLPVEVIMVTAANDTTTIDDTMHLGVLDYLIKPFALDRLQIALEKFSAKFCTLQQNEVLDQSSLDSIITNNSTPLRCNEFPYPKGIQQKTLNNIEEFFKENKGWHTVDMIAEKLGLSIVTVRHYTTYLVEKKQIIEDINYETGGRPSLLYKKK